MTITHYRGYSICQQREFGPLKLLKWVENGDFVIIKDNSDFMPGTTFRTAEDAKKVIDVHEDVHERIRRRFLP